VTLCHIDSLMAKQPSSGATDPMAPDAQRAARLLAWYDRVKRSLPWRLNADPYRVWVSEVMLQQTRVETAIPYYERFLAAFPSVEDLAQATQDEVLAQWSGLGYYRRARSLLAGAREVVGSGGFPGTAEGWRRLPGVGPYTAAAVASIVFREKVVALDGNLERVMARLEAYSGNPKTAAGRRFLTLAADGWLDPARPGDSNQALMELGATVCLPNKPLCGECPILASCRANDEGRVDDYPSRVRAARKTSRTLSAVCVKNGVRFLLFRRDPGAGLLAGTWELPWVDEREPDSAQALSERYGGTWRLGEGIATIRHTITSHDLTIIVSSGSVEGLGSIAEHEAARWASLTDLDGLPHSSVVRKAFAAAV